MLQCVLVATHRVVMVTFHTRLWLPQFFQVPSEHPFIGNGFNHNCCLVCHMLSFITHDICKFVSHRVVFVHSIDLFVHFQLSFVGQEAESIPGIIGSKYGKVVKILDLSYNQLRWL